MGGCMTLNYDAPGRAIALPSAKQLPLHAQLVISDEFRQAKWKDEFEVSVGAALVANAENLARTLFQEVSVCDANTTPRDCVVLTPRLVAIARDRPALATQDQRTDIIVEWTISDGAGTPIWVETVNGHGHAPLSRADQQFDAAIDDLFKKSYQEMSQAREIDAFRD
jgi:hypothetical protein